MSKFDIKLELDAELVKEAIAAYVNKEGLIGILAAPADVDLKIITHHIDRSERTYPKFDKAVVTVNASKSDV